MLTDADKDMMMIGRQLTVYGDKPTSSCTVEGLVRCSTPLCGQAAVGYASRGLRPKCATCMRRNRHRPITVCEMRDRGLIVIPSNASLNLSGDEPEYAPRDC